MPELPPGVEVPVVPELPPGVEVPEGESAGEVVPAGESPGEEPPPGVSDFGWQADSAVIKPSSSITISFDFTVKILTSFNFRLLSYPYSKGGFHFTCEGKYFLAYFTTTKVKCSNTLA